MFHTWIEYPSKFLLLLGHFPSFVPVTNGNQTVVQIAFFSPATGETLTTSNSIEIKQTPNCMPFDGLYLRRSYGTLLRAQRIGICVHGNVGGPDSPG